MPRIAERYGNDPGRVPFDFDDVLAALAPRPVLVIAPVKDGIFDVEGVRAATKRAAEAWRRLRGGGGLTVRHPQGYHHFTAEDRAAAYDWLQSTLEANASGRASPHPPR